MALERKYRTKEIQDLAWAVHSPSLLHSDTGVIEDIGLEFPFDYAADRNSFEIWDHNPDALKRYLAENHSSRLGKYFENLLGFYFETGERFNLIAKGLQVQGKKGTIGEFDFIVKDLGSGTVYHIETAVKFYLQLPEPQSSSPLSHWVGPACKDRFDLKFDKLINKQCRLADLPEAAAVLEPLIGSATAQRYLHLKGCLFTYCRNKRLSYQYQHDRHLHGVWYYVRDLPLLKSDVRWAVTTRLEWLTGCAVKRYKLDREKLEQTVTKLFVTPGLEKQPVMVTGYDKKKTLYRVFIVPDSWPFRK